MVIIYMVEKIISSETLDALKNIGLNLYERNIYVALLSKGVGSAREIAEIAKIPRSRAYDVLESLAERGFTIIQNTKPLKYVAISPEMAIKKQKNILKDQLEDNIQRIEYFNQSNALKELEKIYKNGLSIINPSDISGSLKGKQSFNLHLKGMINQTKNSINIMVTEKGLKELFTSHINTLQKIANTGIKVKILTPVSTQNLNTIRTLSKFAEVKELNNNKISPIGNMIIIDDDQTILGLTDDETTHATQNVSFWTDSDHFTQNFSKNIFNLIWNNTD
jgi:HTH-type transcriptional regulator, sugar sensing transcriptional regulator